MNLNFKVARVFKFSVLLAFLSLSFETFAFKKFPKFSFIPDSTNIDSLTEDLKNYIPSLYPEIIKDRLACMQGKIKMTYSQAVQDYIKFYTIRQRDYTQNILEKSSFYFPIFEEALKRHDMPEELKYLAIVESALTPKAASWAAAVGLWQFIPATGKEYGLQQDWFIDERMDIYKSTDAACRYLKFLYNYHGDWHLALAAYNCGPGRVNWAVKQAGGKNADFWSIYNYLPRETRGYVPAFIAVNYAMKHHKEHFIFPQTPHEPIPADTVLVSQFVNIEEFAKQIDVPKEHLEKLNPHLKKNAIPAYKKNYPLRVPAHKKDYINANRHAILTASSRASRRELNYISGNEAEASTTEGRTKIFHTVTYGQSLAIIALKYGVNATSVRVWNRMVNNMIYPGQKLEVWIKPAANTTPAPVVAVANPKPKTEKTDSNLTTPKTNPSVQANKPMALSTNKPVTTQPKTDLFSRAVKPKPQPKIHIIKSGDTLWDISLKYGGISVDKIKKMNNITDRTMLQPGQKLIVGMN